MFYKREKLLSVSNFGYNKLNAILKNLICMKFLSNWKLFKKNWKWLLIHYVITSELLHSSVDKTPSMTFYYNLKESWDDEKRRNCVKLRHSMLCTNLLKWTKKNFKVAVLNFNGWLVKFSLEILFLLC